MKNKPPKCSKWILERCLIRYSKSPVMGDLDEEFDILVNEVGITGARRWYRRQVMKSMPSGLKHMVCWGHDMLRNYIKITIRNLKRHKAYSFINISGLAIGMACCILILMWVKDELSYDRFHENAGVLHRIITEQRSTGSVTESAETQFPLAPALKSDFPQIIDACRLYTKWKDMFFKYDDKSFVEDGVLFADASFLRMFTFPLKHGDRETVLTDPYSVVMTEDMARKYFSDEEPVGKIIRIDYYRKLTDFRITGILENIPRNSHLQFDFLIPFHVFDVLYADMEDLWRTVDNYQTYVQLHDYASEKEINHLISDYKAKHITQSEDRLHLQPVTSIHLHSQVKFDPSSNSSVRYVYLFSVIAVFTLLIACINFMNLSTARYSNRVREVGLRKVVGARRSQLINQFFVESVVQSLLALLVAILLIGLALPMFNHTAGKQLSLSDYQSITIYVVVFGIAIFTGILSGSYPALILSSFRPIDVLKDASGSAPNRVTGSRLRKMLVLVQFSLSIILIISTIIVSQQLRFLLKRDLGFDKENVIAVPVRGDLVQKYPVLKRELLKHPSIENVSAANILPTHGNESVLDSWDGNDGGDHIVVNITAVDYDYFNTLGIETVEGRLFSRDFPTDRGGAVIVNEEAVRQMGMVSPIGKRVWGRRVIGVVRDYHYKSLHTPVEPMIISHTDKHFYNIFIRVHPVNGDFSGTMTFVKNMYERFVSDYPFEFRFLDSDIQNFYRNEKRIHRLFAYFTILAVFVACLGLFGLASFMAEKRTKEIGIRKVLGASVSEILILLYWEFGIWVLVSNIIAWPVAYFVMRKWLENFAYRTDIGIWTFVMSAGTAFIIALISVSYQSIKAAIANPVDAIKYE